MTNKSTTKPSDKPLNILIGTPAYGCVVHIDYLNSILGCHAIGLPITVLTLGNESLITRARNTVISYFHHHNQQCAKDAKVGQNAAQPFTHLLFLDADIKIDAQDIVRLINHGKPVIGAPVPLKGFDAKSNPVFNVGQLLGEADGLCQSDKLGTAVFMMDRSAVTAVVEQAIEQGLTYSRNPNTRGDTPSDVQYDVFRVGVVPTMDGKSKEYLSEDYYVCHNLRGLGFDINIDTNIRVIHNGNYAFG